MILWVTPFVYNTHSYSSPSPFLYYIPGQHWLIRGLRRQSRRPCLTQSAQMVPERRSNRRRLPLSVHRSRSLRRSGQRRRTGQCAEHRTPGRHFAGLRPGRCPGDCPVGHDGQSDSGHQAGVGRRPVGSERGGAGVCGQVCVVLLWTVP